MIAVPTAFRVRNKTCSVEIGLAVLDEEDDCRSLPEQEVRRRP